MQNHEVIGDVQIQIPATNNSTPGYISQKKKDPLIQKDTYTPMFIEALFTITKTWTQSRCPSNNEWMKKMWHTYIYIYAMKYYSAIKNDKILLFIQSIVNGLDGRDIMLNEINQRRI